MKNVSRLTLPQERNSIFFSFFKKKGKRIREISPQQKKDDKTNTYFSGTKQFARLA